MPLAYSLIKNMTKCEDKTVVNWLRIKWIRVIKQDPLAFYVKEKLDEEHFRRIPIAGLGRGASNGTGLTGTTVQQLYSSSLFITSKKLNDLQTIVKNGAISAAYLPFYKSLPSKNDDDGSDCSENNL